MLSIHTKHDGVVIADVSLSTMERPHSGPTAVVIAVQPVPVKYAWDSRGETTEIELFPLQKG